MEGQQARPFWSIFVLFFILSVYLVPAISQAAVIVAFGDSITRGSNGGYPPKLQSILNSNGHPQTVQNHGVGENHKDRSVMSTN